MKELRGLHRALEERIIRPVAHRACIWHGSHCYSRLGVLLQARDLAAKRCASTVAGASGCGRKNGWPAPVRSGQLVW